MKDSSESDNSMITLSNLSKTYILTSVGRITLSAREASDCSHSPKALSWGDRPVSMTKRMNISRSSSDFDGPSTLPSPQENNRTGNATRRDRSV
ncbi:MAG: hypothetical protein K2F68_06185, partial [Duncaniella sp.]|nr:hypothetical protein [Duncaniella sp.]